MSSYIHRPFQTYPQIVFDNGVAKIVGEKLKQRNVCKAMVLFDKGIEAIGLADQIIGYIEKEKIEVVRINSVQPDPPDTSINEIGAIAREEEIDAIVSIGGGSAIDTGKGVKILRSNEGMISKYFDLSIPLNPGVFFVAIPTTAGTGSESSAGGMIIDTEVGMKKAVGGPGAFVDLALIDPELMLGLPEYLTFATGFDAFAHCVDGILSDKSSQFTKYQAFSGIRLFREGAEKLLEDLKDVEARSKMAAVSTIGGLIIAAAGCSTIHSFAHALGAKYHAAHGNCVAIFIQPVLEAVASTVPDKISFIADGLNIEKQDGESAEELAMRVGNYLTGLIRQTNLKKLEDIVEKKEDAYGIIELAQKDMMTFNSPIELTDERAKRIIDRAYEL